MLPERGVFVKARTTAVFVCVVCCLLRTGMGHACGRSVRCVGEVSFICCCGTAVLPYSDGCSVVLAIRVRACAVRKTFDRVNILSFDCEFLQTSP